MSKAALESLTTEISRKRRELTRVQRHLENLFDRLNVIEASAKSANRKRYSTAEVKRSLGIESEEITQREARART